MTRCCARRCGLFYFFFQAEDGIRYLVRSRGLGDVYKRQEQSFALPPGHTGRGILSLSLDAAGNVLAGTERGLSLIHI